MDALRSGISLIDVSSVDTRYSVMDMKSERTGTASMTKSTSERSSRLVVQLNRSRAAFASSFDIRCFDTSFSSSLSVGDSKIHGSSGTPRSSDGRYLRTSSPCQWTLVNYLPV